MSSSLLYSRRSVVASLASIYVAFGAFSQLWLTKLSEWC